MRETSIVDNKNCKTQAHARVCEENKLEELELEKNDAYWINFVVEGASLKDHIKRVEMYQDDILKDDSPYHKGISTVLS